MPQGELKGPRLIGIGVLFGNSWNFFKEHIKKLALIALLMLVPSILTQLLDFIFVGERGGGLLAILIILSVLSIVFRLLAQW